MGKVISWEFVLEIDEDEIQKELGIDDQGKVQKTIDSSFIKYMRNKMPYYEGIMAANTKAVKPGLVEVNVPYAHYMNEGILYVNPKYKASGFPKIAPNGTVVGFYGFKGKRVPTSRPLKYREAPTRGAHFVERTIAQNRDDIIKEAQRSIGK